MTDQASIHKQLLEKGVTEEEVSKLGRRYSAIVNNILKHDNLTHDQIRRLVVDLLDHEDDRNKLQKGKLSLPKGVKNLPKHDFTMYKPYLQEESKVSTQATSPSEAHSTGVIRNVISQWGYSSASMYIDLPSVYLNQVNDVSAYVFGGAYTKNPATGMPYSGADLGVGTTDSNGRYWFPVIYLGKPNWDGPRLPGEDEDGWYQSPVVIDKNVYQKLYLVFEANDDQLELQVWDAVGWNKLSHMNMYAPGRFFTNEGQNVQLAQQTSICYGYDEVNEVYKGYLQSGSYLRYATYSNVYIYNDLNLPNGALWTSSYTSAITKGETPQAATKIFSTVFSADYNHQVSINLQ